ncbi:type IV pilus secretin PilQ [Granulosicoccaceae sp. 1_MG-2023]|nr:type IV pilus secretin PilQ [Granulosicoccaceae sp. 1_MG-2023]
MKTFGGIAHKQSPATVHSSRKPALGTLAAVAMALNVALATPALADSTVLQDISHVALPGNQQQLSLKFDGDVVEPRTFTIDNPARIALDFPGTSLGLDQRMIPIGSGLVRSVTSVEANGRTRVVINLASMVPYSTRMTEDGLLVTLQSGRESASSQTSGPGIESMAKGTVSKQVDDRAVNDIDFRRGPNGEGRIVFGLSKPGVPMDVVEEGGRIVINFPGSRTAPELLKRLDVTDFGTPVQFIDTRATNSGTRVVVQPAGEDFEQLAYQSDNVFTLELKPMPKEDIEAERKKKFGYTGERLSLNFQDIEVRSVLQLLADFTELNIVVSDNVDGKLTLRLKNVPWDQALDIILKSKNLGKRQSGNVIMVAPAEEIAARERVELEAQQQKTELAPLRSEFFQINYADAADFSALLKTDAGGVLSERGSVTVDNRTNALLISDTAERLDAVRALINKLDIPVRQVLIESRIVVAYDNFANELGMRMGVNRDTTGDGDGFVLSGDADGIEDLINDDDLGDGRYNVDLAASDSTGTIGLALAKLPFGTLLELELSAMQAEGNGEVVSSPRIITANQNQARIEQGVEIAYQEASSSGATSTSFKKAVLSLDVTPQITPDDRIIMDLTVSKDSVGDYYDGVPSIDTREVSTQVLVDNGETVVLGGIYEQEQSDDVDKVPFFGDLPLIGRLFKRTMHKNEKSELLVFVTPKIIRENSSIGY